MNGSSAFTGALLVFVLVLIAQSFLLSDLSRAAPLSVLLLTESLLLVRLVLDLPSRQSEPSGRERIGSGSRAPEEDEFFDARRVGGPEWTGRATTRRRELRIAVWIAGLVGLVYLAGFFPAVPIFLLLFLRIEAELGWREAALFTGAFVGSAYMLLVVLADVSLPYGILGGM